MPLSTSRNILKKKEIKDIKEFKNPDQHMVSQPVSETLTVNYMPYAMSVIVSRAIPEIDGFKPAHRKLLYTMYKMGLLNGSRTKSANVVGQTMKLNPHGDASIYETMVRLTRGNESLLYPYVDSKGNMGKHYSRDMAFAASRYTEVKLDPFSAELFSGLDKGATDFVDNYDGTMKEPLLFPVTFPNVLVNANQGIAVGMASNICSFNLSEVCKATILHIQEPDADIMSVMPAPDFSTGGTILLDKNEMRKIYKTGKGSIRVRGKYSFDSKSNIIDITEIPYSTTIEAIIEDITNLVKQNRIKEINDVRDETDLNGLKISIDLKRGADPDLLMKKLFKFTKLEDSFSCNFNVLINGYPVVLGVTQIIEEWYKWRKECLKKELLFDMNKKQEKLHLLIGLQKILLDIDKTIKIIRETKKEKDVVPSLMAAFDLDEKQANYIAEIKLRNINEEYILNRTKEISSLEKEIKKIDSTIKSNAKINKLIISNLELIDKKYGKPRKSDIVKITDVDTNIPDESEDKTIVRLMLTKEGYIKKLSTIAMRSSPEIKLKENDEIVFNDDVPSNMELLIFTNQCNVYKTKVSNISQCKPSELGDYYGNIGDCPPEEELIGIIKTMDYSENVLIAFENGKIAKIPISAYQTKQNRKKLINSFSDKSKVISIIEIKDDIDIGINSDTKLLVFNSSKIPLKTSKTTQGVQCLRLGKNTVAKEMKPFSEYNMESASGFGCKSLPASGGKYSLQTVNNPRLKS